MHLSKGIFQLYTKKFIQKFGFDIVRNSRYAGVMPLKAKHISNCHIIENRVKLLELLPHHAVCSEIGIESGSFSEKILTITNPEKFHLIDINAEFIRAVKKKLFPFQNTKIFFHLGASDIVIKGFSDYYFDWVYIDADHSYAAVKKDLAAVRLKVKKNGLIVLNDYIFYDHLVKSKYGVIEAVNEFCNLYNYELIYLALQNQMFNDVVIKKIGT